MIDYLKKYFKNEFIILKEKTKKVYDLKVDDKSFVLKEEEIKIEHIYNYLKKLNLTNIAYPIDNFLINNRNYQLFNKIEEINYPSARKLLDLKDNLYILHENTKIIKRVKKQDIKYLFRIDYKLNYRFSLLESYIRTIEMKQDKKDDDWIILSKYNIYLDTKKELEKLSSKIYKYIEEKKSLEYTIVHGKPILDHLKNNKLISFENSKIGYFVSDVSKFYVENEHINIDWNNLIGNWIYNENDKININYFKFLCLYIYILNLNISYSNSYITLNNYIRISEKLKRFFNIFQNLN